MTRQPLDEGASMLPSARPARRAITGAIGTGALAGAMLFGAAATATADAATPSSTAVHGRRTGARHVRRHVRHVELPNPPPRRERLLHQPQRPTQGSDPRSGTDLSRRQSASSGRASGHPATLGRLPPTLWGAGNAVLFGGVVTSRRPLTRCGGDVPCRSSGGLPRLAVRCRWIGASSLPSVS